MFSSVLLLLVFLLALSSAKMAVRGTAVRVARPQTARLKKSRPLTTATNGLTRTWNLQPRTISQHTSQSQPTRAKPKQLKTDPSQNKKIQKPKKQKAKPKAKAQKPTKPKAKSQARNQPPKVNQTKKELPDNPQFPSNGTLWAGGPWEG